MPVPPALSRERRSRPWLRTRCVVDQGVVDVVVLIARPADDTRRVQSAGAFARPHEPSTVLVLHGDVEVSTARLLADSLSVLLAMSAGAVVIDLTDVEFIDIASVRLFDLGRQLLARQGRDLTFRSPSRLGVLMLGLFGLTSLVEIRNSTRP